MSINGTVNDDTLTGTSGDDTILSGAKNDSTTGDAGNDSIQGGLGRDTIDGGTGNDSLRGDEGADRITGGTGNDQIDFTDTDDATDTLVLSDGDAQDTVTGFSGPVDDGFGGFISEDRFDVTGLTDANADPVNAWDVVVSDDGSGNAVLTFPDGTSTTLIGVSPTQVDTSAELVAMDIPCFAAVTMIETGRGAVAIEKLTEGDLVQTRDHGLQPIRWIGWRTVDARHDLAPIRIKAGTFGNDRDLLVSPQHRILVSDWMAELLFGEDEV